MAHLSSVAGIKIWKDRTDFRVIKYVLHRLPCFPVREVKRSFPAHVAITLCGRFVDAPQSEADGFQLNESKWKDLRISFSSLGSTVDPITTNDKQIKVVSSAKLLGVVISDDFK